MNSSDYNNGNRNELTANSANNLYATDPQLKDTSNAAGADNTHRTADDGLMLKASSPCINAGTNIGAPTTDILGKARNGNVEIGAYEYYNNFSCPTGTTLYVDSAAAANGVGTSWSTAFKDLSAALDVAHQCSTITTILVAKGTYYPSKKPYNNGVEMTTSDPRDVTFHLPDGLTLEGGYPNGGGAQNISNNRTILSGDIQQKNTSSDNTYHVLLAVADPTTGKGVSVSGFEIIRGYAITFTPVVLKVNGADVYPVSGAGIFLFAGNNALNSNIFKEDSSFINDPLVGGTVFSIYGTNDIQDNEFSNNMGGIKQWVGKNAIHHNRFTSNDAAIDISLGVNNISDNIFTKNNVGSVIIFRGKNKITNNLFLNNYSTSYGAALYLKGDTSIIFNNAFSNNRTTNGGGGAIYMENSKDTFSNNTFVGNRADGNDGGAIYGLTSTNVYQNNIFWGNSAKGSNNQAGSDIYLTPGNYTFNNNLLHLPSASYTTGNNNNLGTQANNIFATDPMLMDTADLDGNDNKLLTNDDGLMPLPGSPAIDGGTNAGAPSSDIRGSSYIITRDIGAYEYGTKPGKAPYVNDTLYVDIVTNAFTPNKINGNTWDSAFTNLQQALDTAMKHGHVKYILVAKGTYNVPAIGTFAMRDSLTLLGAYPTGGQGLQDTTANKTTLLGNSKNAVLEALSLSKGITLDGFHITNGGNSGLLLKAQDGITPNCMISNNTFTGNSAPYFGGAVFSELVSCTFTYNIFTSNTAISGGAINAEASCILTNNVFTGNSAQYSGGAVVVHTSSEFINNNYTGNITQNVGGAISAASNCKFINNTFIGNKSS